MVAYLRPSNEMSAFFFGGGHFFFSKENLLKSYWKRFSIVFRLNTCQEKHGHVYRTKIDISFFFSYLNNYFILENYAYTCHRTTNILFNFYSENHKYHETWSNGIQSQETTFTEIVEEEWG